MATDHGSPSSDRIFVVHCGRLYSPSPYIAKVRVCEVCGQYRGEMFRPADGHTVKITCLCDGRDCAICGRRRLYKRGSEIMDASGRVWHVPGAYSTNVCDECAKKQGLVIKTYSEVLGEEGIRQLEQHFGRKDTRGPFSEGWPSPGAKNDDPDDIPF